MSFVCLFFGFQYLADIAYTSVTKRNFRPYSFKSILDMLIFFIFMVNICVTFARNLKSTISEGLGVVSWEEKAIKYSRNYIENNIKETNLLILGVVCLWLRVLNFTRYNEYLGRFIGVV